MQVDFIEDLDLAVIIEMNTLMLRNMVEVDLLLNIRRITPEQTLSTQST